MKKKFFSILIALCLALTMCVSLVACGGKPPAVQTGEIYRTSVVKYNSAVSAYISFKDYGEESNEWGESGKVYEVRVSQAGGSFGMWSDGLWSLEGNTLTITPKNQDDKTCIADTEKNVAKTFTATDGVFKFEVKVSGCGSAEFTFNPETDKVGEDTKDPCTQHKDENNDGKCDICGEDMPVVTTPDILIESATSDYGQKAKIEFFNADKTWKLYLIYATGMEYAYVAGGTFEVDSTTYNMALTVTDDQASMIKTSPLTVSVDASQYPVIKYNCELTVAIPQIGNLNFALSVPDPEIHYTVTFDWNYTGSKSVQVITKTFTDAESNKVEYADRDEDWIPEEEQTLRVPVREGYRFAGWDFKQNPVLENGASKTEYYPGQRQPSYNTNNSTPNGVYPITQDTTIYARWVQETHIKTEAELRAIADDLSGWYILDNDITLTQNWIPVGKYYSHYEFINASWWKYAFNGIFDGNNHTISGLNINTLTPYEDKSETDSLGNPIGNPNGTTAMFGAVANGIVKNVRLNAPKINVTDYENRHHAYVAVLVGFTMGSNCLFENNIITNADVDVTLKNIDYVAVAGMIAGHWGGRIEGGSITGSMEIALNYSTDYEGVEINAFFGQLAGENWENLVNVECNMTLNATVSDPRTSNELPANSAINLYAGGAGGSCAFSDRVTASGTVTVDASGIVENKLIGRFGGIGGAQGHGWMKDCTLTTAFNIKTNNAESNILKYGSVIGSYNEFGMWMSTLDRLQYDGHLKVNNCNGSGVTMTIDNNVKVLETVGVLPTAQELSANPYLAYICPVLANYTENGVTDWDRFINDIFGVLSISE